MAVTITVVEKSNSRDGNVTYADVVGPASYTTGGEVLTVAQVNQLLPMLGGALTAVTDINKAQFIESECTATGQTISIDRATGKVVYWAGAQVGSGTNLSTVTCRVRVKYGKVNLG